MALDNTSKNAGIIIFQIGVSAGTSLTRALRDFLTAVKYANVKYGEKHYKDFLKGEKGHQFRKEDNFINFTMNTRKSDIARESVTVEEKNFIKDRCAKLGIDYQLASRPPNLEKLVERKFLNGEELSAQEEKLVQAFTIRDGNGKLVMNPDHPKLPLLKKDEYLLTIAEKDLPKWEVICMHLERKRDISLQRKARNAKRMAKVKNMSKIAQEKAINLSRGVER